MEGRIFITKKKGDSPSANEKRGKQGGTGQDKSQLNLKERAQRTRKGGTLARKYQTGIRCCHRAQPAREKVREAAPSSPEKGERELIWALKKGPSLERRSPSEEVKQ